MTERNSTLAKAAEAAFSEGPVDWPSLLESSSNDEERRVIENLRIIRGIADFNRLQMAGVASGEISRRIASDEPSRPDSPAVPAFPVIPSEEPPRNWGKFELRRKIGAGAYGDVYLAYDPDLEREVALKIYRNPAAGGGVQRQGPDDTAAAQDRRRTIMREARLMARVQHPNVVTVYGAEEIQGEVGLWMDYIKGQTLHEWVRSQGRLGAQEAIVIGLDVCRALAAVHARGLIHQDVKAQNVMREEGGRIVLMDFGIGLEIPEENGDALQSGSGTPTYMAPEKLLQGVTSIASDVYSLGVLIFYLVTGRYPVDARTFPELLQAHRDGKRVLLRDVRPELPAALIDVAEKAMSPDPKGRYASMGAMEKALSCVLGVAERVRAVPTKAARFSPRRNLLFLLPVLVLLAIAAWGVYRWSDRLLPHRNATIRQITMNAEGNPVRAIALSPDGRLLAYTDRTGLYLRDVDTGETKSLPQLGDSAIYRLQWFPEGRKLLVSYQSSQASRPDARTCVLSLDGGGTEALCSASAHLIPPDYNRLFVMDSDSSATIRDLQGTNITAFAYPQLPRGWTRTPWWSTTGGRWAYLLRDSTGVRHVKCFDSMGQDEVPILSPIRLAVNLDVSDFLWMDDGRLLYSTTHKRKYQDLTDLWCLRVNPTTGHTSGKVHRIYTFEDARILRDLSASRDGKKLAALGCLTQIEIFLADLSGNGSGLGSVRRLTQSSGEDIPDAWTADGRDLLFTSDRNGTMDLFMQDTASSAPRLLPGTLTGSRHGATITPADKDVLYWSEGISSSSGARADSADLRIMPLAGGLARVLLRAPRGADAGCDCPSTPDRGCVYASMDGHTLRFRELDLKHGLGDHLADYEIRNAVSLRWALSPDGSQVAIIDDSDQREVYAPGQREVVRLLDLATGGVREIATRGENIFMDVRWASDGNSLYSSGYTASYQTALFRISLDGRVESLLQRAAGGDGRLGGPVPSPDGKHLAFYEFMKDANAWLIEGF